MSNTQAISNTLRDAAGKSILRMAVVPQGLLYSSASELERLAADLARAQAALGQASFCLRQIAPDDPDAQFTVKMIEKART